MTARRTVRLWEHCPSCDAPLSVKIAIGDNWDCATCGESGTREPGPYDDMPLLQLSPQDKLLNVAKTVKAYTTPVSVHNGKNRQPSYPVDKHTIALAARQLAEMVEQYLNGELNPTQNELPF